jgi:23S rRNA (cytosine1962-C5)-methyltransferase
MQPLLDAIAQAHDMGDAARVFHGRGGRFAGCEAWSLDWYNPVWVFTAFEPVSEPDLLRVGECLARRCQNSSIPLNWVYQCRHPIGPHTRLMTGSVPNPHVVEEAGSRFVVHVLKGQNHGLFLDMSQGRRWVRSHAHKRKVLNLFAYTCGFSVAAMQGGARQVVNLDMSAAALAIGQHNHQLNGLNQGAHFLPHDVFKTWGKLQRMGPYDLIVVDPPSHQKGSFVATKDYPRLLRRMPELLAPEAQLLLCLNAPELNEAFLREHMQAQAPDLVFEQRLPNPAAFADSDEQRSLKVLVFRAPALPQRTPA